jgi:hypothetical protein
MTTQVATTTTLPTPTTPTTGPSVGQPSFDLNEIANEIPKAFTNYVHENVVVTVAPIVAQGNSVNKGETFTFLVDVANNGNVQLKNLRYRISVNSTIVATLFTQATSGGSYSTLAGNSLGPGEHVGAFIFTPGNSVLAPGEQADTFTVYGDAVKGGTTSIKVGITVDIDLDQFCKNRNSWQKTEQLVVVD